jgi:phage shock protein C
MRIPDMRHGSSSGSRLELDHRNGLIAGVCAGIARWLDVDVTWVRIAAVIATVVVTKVAIALYVIGWLLLDDRGDP